MNFVSAQDCAVVVRPLADGLWQVKAAGGIFWRAHAVGGDLHEGDLVKVLERQGTRLFVQCVTPLSCNVPT